MSGVESSLCTAVTSQNAVENSFSLFKVYLPSHDTSALQPTVFSTGIHRLLVINTERSAQHK